uniref:Uncharacterized protein n=1 Tax=Anguilla anguilla TaxID=7936 RepID=A0A0E9VEF9_ANGAN
MHINVEYERYAYTYMHAKVYIVASPGSRQL